MSKDSASEVVASKPKAAVRVIRNIQELPKKVKEGIRRKVYEAFKAGGRKSDVVRRLKLRGWIVGRMCRHFEKDGEAAVVGDERKARCIKSPLRARIQALTATEPQTAGFEVRIR